MRKFKITRVLYYILLDSKDLQHQCLRHQTTKLTNEHVKQNQLGSQSIPWKLQRKEKKSEA